MIYLERTINLNKGNAVIDEPIILYKGDKNVEIQFNIKNNPFKTKSGIGITFGQLIIDRKSADSIFSSVERLSNNKVIFVITGDMIDELCECNEYDFQIRLFNDEQSSRATLAPVSKGIIIREPICEDDYPGGIATVNTGTVNYSAVGIGETLEAFDAYGDYIKTNWSDKDVITDGKLNKVEDALYTINNKIPSEDALLDLKNGLYDLEQVCEFHHQEIYSKIGYIEIQLDGSDGVKERLDDIESSNYATEQYVQDAIDNIDIPDSIKTFGDGVNEYIFTGKEFADEFASGYLDKSYMAIFKNVTIECEGQSDEIETYQIPGEQQVFIDLISDEYEGKHLNVFVDKLYGNDLYYFLVREDNDVMLRLLEFSRNIFTTNSSVQSSLQNYAQKYELEAYATKEEIEFAGYITHVALESKHYATEQFVQDAIDAIEIPEGGGNVDLTGYATEQYVDDTIKGFAVINKIQGLVYFGSNGFNSLSARFEKDGLYLPGASFTAKYYNPKTNEEEYLDLSEKIIYVKKGTWTYQDVSCDMLEIQDYKDSITYKLVNYNGVMTLNSKEMPYATEEYIQDVLGDIDSILGGI